MAFCNSCGQMLATGAKFCAKCGAAQPGGAVPMVTATPVPASAPSAPVAQPQSNSALKVILIVVVVVITLGMLAAGTVAFIGWKIAHNVRIQERDGKSRVETPFGTVESSDNPADVARDLGIDVYPGARVLKSGAANVHVGSMHTVAADFESDDPPEKVAEFYKSKFPSANVTSTQGDRTSIISTDKKNLITIVIEPRNGKTTIHIANVSGTASSGNNN